MICWRYILIFLFSGLFLNNLFTCYAKELAQCQNVPEIFKELTEKLLADGFDQRMVCKIFTDKRVRFNPKVMPRKMVHKESKLNYDVFLDDRRIKRAKNYLSAYSKLFNSIEQEYGIPKEIKVAILLVETDLGRYLGSSLAINTLASMAVAKDFDSIKKYLPIKYKKITNKTKQRLNKKLLKKSTWAYSELKSLLIYAQKNNLDIFNIKGSIFGAIGLCQFMPSNALKFGVDYNKDGKVDLFDPADAIASMANYLRYYGWQGKLDYKKKMKVIMHYNHSKPYARTVIKVANKVSNMS